MNKLFLVLIISLFSGLSMAQPNFTANDQVATPAPFRIGVNPNYHPGWTDEKLADIAAGNPNIPTSGAGIRAFRVPLPESFLDTYGYNIRLSTFQHYESLNIKNNTVFLESPTGTHKDNTEYCNGTNSLLFTNMYLPIWDDANGTPYNDDNYAAAYIYKTVTLYKDYVKYWEVWNEPDFTDSQKGWLPPGQEGNWWDNTPQPCDLKNLKAPAFHYIRLLRIAYEVVKTLDPDAYVTVGGLGYESFLDFILRSTDNPDNGVVTTDYPLKGGAYFDALSYHSYPHINGSLKYWDNGCSCMLYTRHSDPAAKGIFTAKGKFETVLNNHGYNNTTYPKKETIITETNVPNQVRQGWDEVDYLGSYEAQRNFALKVLVYAYENNIQQLDFYVLADTANINNASHWTSVSGLYRRISNQTPYNVTYNEEGTALRTFTDLIWGATYDAARTAALNLPATISGGAFLKPDGKYTYVLWAKTTTDQSEVASATYDFPAALGIESLTKKEWDFSVTGTSTLIEPTNNSMSRSLEPTNVALTGAPVFLEESPAPLPVDLVNFSAKNSKGQALLSWTTASEKNNRGFNVQHSLSGINWETIGFVNGAGNSSEKIDYEYRHQAPSGINFYRLKQMDFDERFTFSDIKSVNISSDKSAVLIYPSITKGQLTITNFEGKASVYTMTGQLLKRFNCTNEENHLDLQYLSNGSYHILLESTNGELTNQFFIKQ